MSRDLLSTVHQVLSSNELEIQELVNRISAARYLPEVTKEAMIAELSPELLKRAREKAFRKRDDDKDTGSGMSGKYVGQRQANKFGAGAKRAETGIKSQGDAMKYYRDKKRAPSGWRVIDTGSGKKVVKEEELKEQDVDDMKDQVRDMEKTLKDKIYKDEWDRRDDEAVALQARIDKKKADIKDKESRTTHGSGHKSPGQTSFRGA